MLRSSYKQTIKGNPGDCYIACLLFVLKQKYGILTNYKDQRDIYSKGILESKMTWYMGAVNRVATRYKKPIAVYTSYRPEAINAERESLNGLVVVKFSNLTLSTIKKMLDQDRFVILSVDRFVIKKHYHDFFFVTVIKDGGNYKIHEPIIGKTFTIDEELLNKYLYSTRMGLNDLAIALTV